MVYEGEIACPCCGGVLLYYGRVKRIVRTRERESRWIFIRRLKCGVCGSFHRELPSYICPYKQYESELINGVIEGIISPNVLGYEDYPCEMTMKRWKHI